jgi:ABC-type bacteriocin/lantibiotic exporter with double-glycine peptidase domain
MFTEFESTLVSYERCLKIFEIPQEAPQHIEQTYNANWPKTGQIEFDKLTLKYRPDTDIVLNSLSFKIKNGEKIGVIGRTGAGKSTL